MKGVIDQGDHANASMHMSLEQTLITKRPKQVIFEKKERNRPVEVI